MEKRTQNMIKNSAILMVGNFSSRILIFILLPLYTYYLTTTEYGTVDIYINILSILYCFASLQAIESVYRFIQDADTEDAKKLVVSNSFLIAIIGIVAFSIGMVIYGVVSDFSYTTIFVIYMATNILSQFCQQTIRGLNKMLLYSAVGIISTLFQVGCNVLFIVLFHCGAVSLLWSYIVTYIAIIICVLLKCNVLAYVSFKFINCEEIKRQLKYSIPLMPNGLCLWGINSLGRYLLLIFHSTAEVGLLAFATKFSQLLGVVNSVFFMAWQQSAISEYKSSDKDEYASRVFNRFVGIQLCAIAVLLPATKLAVFSIMGSAYREAWTYVPAFFIGILFNAYANFVSMGFYGAKRTGTVFLASFFAMAIYAILGYFGAKYYYIMGVGGAYAFSQIVYFAIMKYRVDTYMHITVEMGKWILPLTLSVISIALYYSVASMLSLLAIVVVIACIVLCYNRDVIRKILAMFMKRI